MILGFLINHEDLEALSIRRGSLTKNERKIIEDHVVYTKKFLSQLPWPPELQNVPSIAGAHHEKLNGTGYPEGLVKDEIPIASRVMAVCDIYDALTALDRPYKPALSPDAAFGILYEEAQAGLLQKNIVDIFIQSRSYEAATPNRPPKAPKEFVQAVPRCKHGH